MSDLNRMKKLAGLYEQQEPFERAVRRALANMREFINSEPVGFDDAEHLASEWFAQHPNGHGDWNKLSPEIKTMWTQLANIAMHGESGDNL